MNDENWSYDVKFWNTDIRQNRPTPYRVRWVVDGQVFSDSFTTSGFLIPKVVPHIFRMLVSVTRTADGSLEGQRWEVTVTIRGPEHAEQASRDAPVPVEELARGKRVRGRSSPSMTWCARGCSSRTRSGRSSCRTFTRAAVLAWRELRCPGHRRGSASFRVSCRSAPGSPDCSDVVSSQCGVVIVVS